MIHDKPCIQLLFVCLPVAMSYCLMHIKCYKSIWHQLAQRSYTLASGIAICIIIEYVAALTHTILHVITRTYTSLPPWGGGGGSTSPNFRQHAKYFWTHSDRRFCENEVSKRSKIKDKWVNWIENQ